MKVLADALKTHVRPEYLHSILEEYAIKLVKVGEELTASGLKVTEYIRLAFECYGISTLLHPVE